MQHACITFTYKKWGHSESLARRISFLGNKIVNSKNAQKQKLKNNVVQSTLKFEILSAKGKEIDFFFNKKFWIYF